jgi:hypothetical protein
MSVNNLAVDLAEAGRRPEGLTAAQEAVDLCRELVAGNRDALWVPKSRSHHATCRYSWMTPPRRSRRSGWRGGRCVGERLPDGTEDLWSSEYLELVQLASSGDSAIFGTTRSGDSFRESC